MHRLGPQVRICAAFRRLRRGVVMLFVLGGDFRWCAGQCIATLFCSSVERLRATFVGCHFVRQLHGTNGHPPLY